MNKSYIIITTSIGDMGGAQMYTDNKVSFLKSCGWNVHVFFAIRSKSQMLPLLSEYEDNYIGNLLYYKPYFVPKYYVNNVIKRIKSAIGNSDEIVVETHTLPFSFWGEILAKQLNAKHIINYLEEPIIRLSPEEADFFEFKLRRWEFMNASERNLKRVFKNYYKDDFAPFFNDVDFVCSNVIKTTPNDSSYTSCHFEEADYTILSIGRLEKPYIDGMNKNILDFVAMHQEHRFNIIYVGGSLDGSKETEIVELFKNCNNAIVYVLGFLFPVPREIVLEADVAIATANAVLVSSDLNVPTVVMDIDDFNPIGIFGITTKNRFLREDEPIIELKEWLEEILIKKKYAQPKPTNNTSNEHVEEELRKQEEFVYKTPNDLKYYEVNRIYHGQPKILSKLKWMMHTYLHV